MSYFVNILRAIFTPAALIAPAAPVVTVDPTVAARTAITTALNDTRFEFRTIGALVSAVGNGATEEFVNGVVNGMSGVRRAYGKPHLIGLTSKIGDEPRRANYSF